MSLDESTIELCEAFLRTLKRKGYTRATLRGWRFSLHRFFRFAHARGVTNLRYVPPDVLSAFRAEIKHSGCTSDSIMRHPRRVLAFYGWLTDPRRRSRRR